ncbi:MAG: zf-HC2 domain-containing protein [Candidatus Eremiobacteraeota bacterium]|nr:zf-HC2 domain-containing protein [Candidatus Eremiobacteraeota bacterium]
MTHEQCGDLAELYALGAVDDAERATVEEHLRDCPTCAQIVAAAERDVALIASSEPQREPPPDLTRRVERELAPPRQHWPLPAALAAALIVGLLPSAYLWNKNRAMHDAMRTQSGAMERLAVAPHRMAHFQTERGMPPAEVAYAADGSWYFVIVHASMALSLVWMHDGERTILGNAVPQGNIATLYLPRSHRMDRLALMDGNRIIGEAVLSWQKTAPAHRGGRSA